MCRGPGWVMTLWRGRRTYAGTDALSPCVRQRSAFWPNTKKIPSFASSVPTCARQRVRFEIFDIFLLPRQRKTLYSGLSPWLEPLRAIREIKTKFNLNLNREILCYIAYSLYKKAKLLGNSNSSVEPALVCKEVTYKCEIFLTYFKYSAVKPLLQECRILFYFH